MRQILKYKILSECSILQLNTILAAHGFRQMCDCITHKLLLHVLFHLQTVHRNFKITRIAAISRTCQIYGKHPPTITPLYRGAIWSRPCK